MPNTQTAEAVETSLNQQHVNTLAAEILDIINSGKKAEKAVQGVYNALLDIARKSENRAEFTAASDYAEREYKRKQERAKTSTNLPPAFIQARSNIKRFYD